MDPKPEICTVLELKNRNKMCEDLDRPAGQKQDLELSKSREAQTLRGTNFSKGNLGKSA